MKTKIVPYKEELAPYFDSINRQWIQSMFEMEPIDEKIITNPKEVIIESGGKILFVELERYGIVGTGALLNKGEGAFELTKMGVLEEARGHKAGEKLLQALINQAKELDAKKLFLLTNKKCEAAIHLYKKMGFKSCPELLDQYAGDYTRCDVAMVYAG